MNKPTVIGTTSAARSLTQAEITCLLINPRKMCTHVEFLYRFRCDEIGMHKLISGAMKNKIRCIGSPGARLYLRLT